MLREATHDTGRLMLNVAEGPLSGPPLVFLHGVTRRWQDFATLIPTLLPRWHIVAPDLRGHGRSDRASGEYLVVDYLADVVCLVERQSEPAILFGHSLGAMVAVGCAASLPNRVRAVILEDPPFDTLAGQIHRTPYQSLFAGFRELARAGRNVADTSAALAEMRIGLPGDDQPRRLGDMRDATSLRFSARCLGLLDPECLTPILEGRWLDRFDRDALLARVTCPVLILQGNPALGGMLSDVDAKNVAGRLADCTRISLPQVGHNIHWLATEDTLRHVCSFLESL